MVLDSISAQSFPPRLTICLDQSLEGAKQQLYSCTPYLRQLQVDQRGLMQATGTMRPRGAELVFEGPLSVLLRPWMLGCPPPFTRMNDSRCA